MWNHGPIIYGNTEQSFLNVYDYIASENGVFFAQMRENGDFCVYSGAPSETAAGAHRVWDTGYNGATYFNYMLIISNGKLIVTYYTNDTGNTIVWNCPATNPTPDKNNGGYMELKNDGNLVWYSGLTPNAPGNIIWQSGVTDPIVDSVEIQSIKYDLGNATISSSTHASLDSLTVPNDTDETQTPSITKELSMTETSGWSDSLEIHLGVKTSFKAGIPVITEAGVEVSLDVTNTYEWNGSESETKTFSYTAPVTVPPHSTVRVIAAATVSNLTVPYTLTGTFKLKSGVTTVPATIQGTYTGTDTHDVTISYARVNTTARSSEEPTVIKLVRGANNTWTAANAASA